MIRKVYGKSAYHTISIYGNCMTRYFSRTLIYGIFWINIVVFEIVWQAFSAPDKRPIKRTKQLTVFRQFLQLNLTTADAGG